MMRLTQLIPTLAAIAVVVLALSPARAGDLPAPSGEPVLTITGAIGKTNQGDAAVFDMAMLEAMPMTRFETATIWTEGTHSFEGVALNDLLAAVGSHGGTISAKAINDYSITIPIADAAPGGPVVAYRMDGAAMSVRDKGPLWIVYPYDSDRKFQSEVIYSRSIWQLDRMVIAE